MFNNTDKLERFSIKKIYLEICHIIFEGQAINLILYHNCIYMYYQLQIIDLIEINIYFKLKNEQLFTNIFYN